MLKKIFILLMIGTLPVLAEPQFDSFDISLLFFYGYISLILEFWMFVSPLILLVVIVIVIKKFLIRKKKNK